VIAAVAAVDFVDEVVGEVHYLHHRAS
jgi:hypothetical protein